jgi:multisubunit Na+/H+ antiporter MnhC subunit
MTTEPLTQEIERHNEVDTAVSRSMARFRAAAPLLRALILVGIVIVLIMFALPRVLAIAAAASL